jgi:hypothetical protein
MIIVAPHSLNDQLGLLARRARPDIRFISGDIDVAATEVKNAAVRWKSTVRYVVEEIV